MSESENERARVAQRERGGGMVGTSHHEELSDSERVKVTEGEWELQRHEEEKESKNPRTERDKKGLDAKTLFFIKKNPTTWVIFKKLMLSKQRQYQFFKNHVKMGISTLVFNKSMLFKHT